MAATPSIAAVGTFDGCHRGHQAIFSALVSAGRSRGLRPVVFSFARHPLALLAPSRMPPALTDTTLRREQILACPDVADVVFLDFTADDFRASARAFAERLRRDYGVEALVMGFNNTIGSDRADAAAIASAGIMPVAATVPPVMVAGAPAASSRVREAVADGSLDLGADILGRPFTVRGRVVHGAAIGATIGFPTANIEPLDPTQLLPPPGVYAVDVTLPAAPCPGARDESRPYGLAYAAADSPHMASGGIVHRGMANIGLRPTLADGRGLVLEVHIIDFRGDLYGRTLDIAFLRRLRDECPFTSLDALRHQLTLDLISARQA